MATNLSTTLILVDRSANTAVPSSDVTFWSISNAPCRKDHDSATRTPTAGLQSAPITLTLHRGTVLGKRTKTSPVASRQPVKSASTPYFFLDVGVRLACLRAR